MLGAHYGRGMSAVDMKVLIVAEHASERFGGEAARPLHYFRVLRSWGVDTCMVVHARTREELVTLFPDDIERIHFVPDTHVHRLLWRCGRRLPHQLALYTSGLISHLFTQLIQRRIVKTLVTQHQIDVVHEPTPVSPKLPSLIYDVGAPVVIGPLNGGMEYPPAFRGRAGRLSPVGVPVGRRLSAVVNRLIPGKLRAATVIVANDRTRDALPKGVRGRVVELTPNAVDLSNWKPRAGSDTSPVGPTHFVFLGRLVDVKGVDLLLEAFKPVAEKCDARLEIVGDGPVRRDLEARSCRLGLTKRVSFSGWLSPSDSAARLQLADVLVFPSLRDCGGAVVLEAMAAGLPVIATNWGGPADYVKGNCGILVEPASRQSFVDGLSCAMLKVARSGELRRQMGRAGRKEAVEHCSWEARVEQLLAIYGETIQRARGSASRESSHPVWLRRRSATSQQRLSGSPTARQTWSP